ncbi:MAG: PD-(D/E)XK nuclease family protein, partial [Spirochaetales bacterium]|nr:PD-(D/E)XK nuclease family protein [Spirochaetales bacterium]
PRGVDATVEPLAAPRPGRLRVSPTALQSFHDCPFAYLLESCLGVSAEDYAVATSDPREMGAIMHRIFEGFVRALQQSDPGSPVVLDPSRSGEYRQLMEATAREACAAWSRRNPLPFAPLWLELQERARSLALDFLETELKTMAGEALTDVELRLEAPCEGEPEVLLVGTIDRVSSRDARTTVVDYKKREVPTAGRILGPDSSSFQIPFYLLLMEANGRPVDRAAYYSIEKRSYTFVLGGRRAPALTRELRAELLGRLGERIRDMVARLRAGDYSIGAPSSETCRRCAHGGICRRRYLLGSGPRGAAGTPPGGGR